MFEKLCNEFTVTLDNTMTQLTNPSETAQVQDGPHIPVNSSGHRTNRHFKPLYECFTSSNAKANDSIVLSQCNSSSTTHFCRIDDPPVKRPKGCPPKTNITLQSANGLR